MPHRSWLLTLRDLIDRVIRMLLVGWGDRSRPAGFTTRASTADLARDALGELPESARADVRNTSAATEERPAAAPEWETADASAMAARELYLRQMRNGAGITTGQSSLMSRLFGPPNRRFTPRSLQPASSP
jgi:hypothetical protein